MGIELLKKVKLTKQPTTQQTQSLDILLRNLLHEFFRGVFFESKNHFCFAFLKPVTWIAQTQLLICSWHVIAIDNNKSALGRVSSLAQQWNCPVASTFSEWRAAVEGQLKPNIGTVLTLFHDVRKKDLAVVLTPLAVSSSVPASLQPFHLVLMSRFLHRPLYPLMRRLVEPMHGVIMISQFYQGASHPTNPDLIVQPGEFKEAFGPAQHMRIECERVCNLEDGRPIQDFLAIYEGPKHKHNHEHEDIEEKEDKEPNQKRAKLADDQWRIAQNALLYQQH
jgi:hypothetical protein